MWDPAMRTQSRDFSLANLDVDIITNGVGEDHASIGENHGASAYANPAGIAFRAENAHAFTLHGLRCRHHWGGLFRGGNRGRAEATLPECSSADRGKERRL